MQQRAYQRVKVSQAVTKLRAIGVLGGVCEICSESDPTVLEFNHRHGDGAQHRKERVGRSGMTYWIVTHPKEAQERIQLVCANCHTRIHSCFNRIEGYSTPIRY